MSITQHSAQSSEVTLQHSFARLFSTKDPVIYWLRIILCFVFLSFSFSSPDKFFTLSNFQSMASQLPLLGVLSLAMSITMLTGGINLSIIATANACALTMAALLQILPDSGLSIPVMLLGGLAVAVIVGGFNGWIVSALGIAPMLATLGTMTLLQGLSILITNGAVISGFPSSLLWLGNGSLIGVPVPLILFGVCLVLVWVLLEHTALGKSIYMLGSNEKATRYSGIDTKKTLIWVYTISALLCMVAGIIMMARFNSAKAGYGESYLLVTILASVLGGINPDGGFGRMTGLLIALVILQMVESGLNLMGVSSYLTLSLWGGILLIFTAVNRTRN